jgi:hypothetical protein
MMAARVRRVGCETRVFGIGAPPGENGFYTGG